MFAAFLLLAINYNSAYNDLKNRNESLEHERAALSGLVNRLIFERSELIKEIYTIELIEYDMAEKTPSIWPVEGRISSPFGTRRTPYRRGQYQFHTGIDIVGRYGDEIRATAGGVVIHAATSGTFGKKIVIDHGYGYTTHYAHLCTYEVTAGDVVEKGQIIGGMGRTGRTTGVHLHYEVRLYEYPVDPIEYMGCGTWQSN